MWPSLAVLMQKEASFIVVNNHSNKTIATTMTMQALAIATAFFADASFFGLFWCFFVLNLLLCQHLLCFLLFPSFLLFLTCWQH